MRLQVLRVLLGAVIVEGETVTGVGVHADKIFGLHHPPITPPKKRMVPNMQPHQTLTTLLRKISTVQMKGPRFTLILETGETGRNIFDQGFFAPQQTIRTDHGLIAEPTVCYLKVSNAYCRGYGVPVNALPLHVSAPLL
ncbi:hypothetical protein EDB84DRAFT_1459428 [Lactarius hengduanensis]|nr:hypothetical protein EDB84DRAFT_1459428 [Lactarius hengduanensis]